MILTTIIRFWKKLLNSSWKNIPGIFLLQLIILSVLITSCKNDPYGSNWFDEENLTISQYLKINQEEYSKFFSLLDKGKLLTTLGAYNPYGEDYTLFLPTDDAIDRFILQNPKYENFEELVRDTSFIYTLTRYHVLKRKVHSDEFPYGALTDSTLTGDRLSIGFYADGDNQIIKVNNVAPIIKSNLKMTNGYIHVISEVLQKSEITGYDWLQQQDDYSILAKTMEVAGMKKGLWWSKYTILAEHDSIYYKKGIFSVQDLISRVATPGLPLNNKQNSFYRFAGYHIVGGEYYMNDFDWGSKKYTTMASTPLTIDVGIKIRINPGVDIYEIEISESGDTTAINYIRLKEEDCNIMTKTGPVHSIQDILYFNPLPE